MPRGETAFIGDEISLRLACSAGAYASPHLRQAGDAATLYLFLLFLPATFSKGKEF